MITTSNSPPCRGGSGTLNQLLGVLLHTIAWYELSRVRTELFQMLVIPSLANHPVPPPRTTAHPPNPAYHTSPSRPPSPNITTHPTPPSHVPAISLYTYIVRDL